MSAHTTLRPRGGAARRRLWRLAAVAGVAVVAAAAAMVVSSRQGEPATPARAPDRSLFAGLPERAGVLGDPSAPVVVTEYLDLQCPVCAESARSQLPGLVRDYVRTGKVRLQARPLQFIGPDSQRAARVAAGAEQQGRLWAFIDAFYAAQGTENSGYVTDDFLRSVSRTAGVDGGKALAAADSAFAQARLNRANADAERFGVDATPTFTVQRGSGPVKVVSAAQLGAVLAAETRR
jgi:protein-disulfide isomerase